MHPSQGDILTLSSYSVPVIVVSREYFNRSGMAFVCPLVQTAAPHVLHIEIHGKNGTCGIALCEAMKALDLEKRLFSIKDEAVQADIMNLSDAIQSVFDYLP